MSSPIERFIGQYCFLSNDYPCTISFRGDLFPSAEHAFQSTKATSEDEYRIIKSAKSSKEARKLGRCISLREGWFDSQVQTMESVLRSKFENPFLAQMLLETYPSLIVHTQTRSPFWGVVEGEGQNQFGLLLMKIRDEIREGGFL